MLQLQQVLGFEQKIEGDINLAKQGK